MSEQHPGDIIRAMREAQGLSLRSLAKELGLSPGTLSGIERKTTPITVARLHQIAEVLGTSAQEILSGSRIGKVTAEAVIHPLGDGDWRNFDSIAMDPIIASALKLFVRKGFHATSMREVANEAGMSVAGVYHHFDSKESLLVAILEVTMSEISWRVEAARAEGEDEVSAFALMVESMALFHAVRGDLAFVGASEMRAFEPKTRERMVALRDEVQHMLDKQAQECFDAGHFQVDDLLTATRAIATMCTSLPTWFRHDGRLSAQDVARHYSTYALHLLGWTSDLENMR